MIKREFLKLGAATALAGQFASTKTAAQAGDLSITIRWLGGATMEITVGEIRFLTDPCFGEGPRAFQMADPNEKFDPAQGPTISPHARLTPFPGLSSDKFDAVLLSHGHEDHFDELARLWLGDNFPLICPVHDAQQMIGYGLDVMPLDHGSGFEIERGNSHVKITAIPAIHSTSPSIADFIGRGNGYFLEARVAEKTRNIYWTGDTFMVEEIRHALSNLPAPGLFIPHLGAVGRTGTFGQLSLNAKQAIHGARTIGAGHVLPIHHSTFSLYQEPVEAIITEHSKLVPEWFDLTVLNEGAALQL